MGITRIITQRGHLTWPTYSLVSVPTLKFKVLADGVSASYGISRYAQLQRSGVGLHDAFIPPFSKFYLKSNIMQSLIGIHPQSNLCLNI